MSKRRNADEKAALVILVPAVENIVRPFRRRYDPSASQGMPAHITINYPFRPSIESRPDLHQELKELFWQHGQFLLSIAKIGRFPDMVYLTLDPEDHIVELIQAIAAKYPDSPPYGGRITTIVPHITVAHSNDPRQLDDIVRELMTASSGRLPIEVMIEKVWLMVYGPAGWTKSRSFPLART